MRRRKLSSQLQQPPMEIIRGAQVTAEYLPQEVRQFQNNPLNEALPPTLTPRDVTDYLFQLPAYSDSDREMSQVARFHMTETAREFFVPNGRHLTVYYAIANMIRMGYVRRNPVLWNYWSQVHENIESFLKAIKKKPFPNSRARGLSIVGCGGTGKSTTVEKILQSLPQVITHVSYKGQDFIMRQLVWLKLDCPRYGSLKELCANFFRAVDEILLTQYEQRYAGSGHRSHEALIAGMARVAANHCLGLIIIDEIQDLSEARSGGEITMVNFFVHLENSLGVPFALIGTQEAIPLLSGQFRQTRRVSEQGYIVWDRMSEVEPEIDEFDDDDDDENSAGAGQNMAKAISADGPNQIQKVPEADLVWKNFVETLWNYQYLKKPRPLKKNIVEDKCAHALYKVAKGIPAVVQTVFVLSQQRAILSEEETLTPRIIHETVRANLQIIKDMLGETRLKKPRQINPIGDLADLDQIYESDDYTRTRIKPEDVDQVHKDPQEFSALNSQAREDILTTENQVQPNHSSESTNQSTSKVTRRSKTTSSSDLPSPTNRSRRQLNSKDLARLDKHRKSPSEYLKAK